ncbi:MAG: MerR family transcriptional regulator [Oscillospiraceae bacterium]|nr:MerR family transcriptional regulator [Oscillospiraceae bacterium]
MTQTYTTKEIADIIGVHVNTVRFYEKIGFLTPPERRPNGYRIYTDLQKEQCRLIRCAMKAEVLQNGLRKKAVEIVRRCAALDFDGAIAAAGEYRVRIDAEIQNAKAAIASVERNLDKSVPADDCAMKRPDAAKALGVTSETLRTWERSGLIERKRGVSRDRVYSAGNMERLKLIRTLRCTNYSLSSILRLLHQLDGHTTRSVETILNTPEENEDIISVCDRLILSLESTASEAAQLIGMLGKIKENFSTLQ